MATKATITTFDDFMFENYGKNEKLELASIYNAPFFGMVKKDTSFTGKYDVVPINVTAAGRGTYASYSKARTNSKAGTQLSFQLPMETRFRSLEIDEQLIVQVAGKNKGAFADLSNMLRWSVDDFKSTIARELYRGTGGALGRLSVSGSTGGAGTFTGSLETPSDARYIEIGDVLTFSANESGASAKTATVTVATVDKIAGTFTVASSTGGGIAVNDYIFPDGNQENGLAGILGWIPETAPTITDSFLTLNRSQNVTALAGLRLDRTGYSKEEGLIDALALCDAHGSRADAVFMHPDDFRDLQKDLSDRKRFNAGAGTPISPRGKKVATFSYGAIMADAPWGEVAVYSDPYCPKGVSPILDMSTWVLKSSQTVPYTRGSDGLKMIRSLDDATYVSDLCAYLNLRCDMPQRNMVVSW